VDDSVMDLLPAARVLVMILAPHTTQFTQLLDLTIFEIFKREKKIHLQFGKLGAIISCVDSVSMKMKMAKRLPLSNATPALQAIVAEFDMSVIPYHAISHQRKLKESQRFGELRINSCLLESLRSGQ
jgi:hypothetical protein